MKRYDICEKANNQGFCKVLLNGKFGVYNTYKGKEVLEPKYEQVTILDCDLFLVKLNQTLGIVTSSQNILFSPHIVSALEYDKDNLLIIEKDNMCLMNKKSFCMSKYYNFINVAENGYMIVRDGNKYGVIDTNFKEVIPCVYDDMHYFKENLFFAHKNKKLFQVCKKQIYTTALIEDELDYTLILKIENIPYYIAFKDNLCGIVNKYLNEVIPIKYSHIQHLQNGIFKVWKNNKVGLLSIGAVVNNILIPVRYESIIPLEHSMYAVQNETLKLALFDPYGKRLTPFKYSRLQSMKKHTIKATVQDDAMIESVGLLNFEGVEVIKPVFDDIQPKRDGFVVVKGTKKGIVNSSFKLVSKIMYDEVYSINEGIMVGNVASVRLNGIDGSFYW